MFQQPSIVNVEQVAGKLYQFGYTKFADFFENDRQTFDQISATFRQFKNWPNWIVSTGDEHIPFHLYWELLLTSQLESSYSLLEEKHGLFPFLLYNTCGSFQLLLHWAGKCTYCQYLYYSYLGTIVQPG